MRRVWIRGGALLLLVAMIWPAAESPTRDSFPLSDYPMFTATRPTVAAFSTVVVVAPDGALRRLDPQAIGGTDQPVQASATVNQAVRNGQTGELCSEIASDVEGPGTVEVVTEVYDTVAWFRGEKDPSRRTVHASCPAGAIS